MVREVGRDRRPFLGEEEEAGGKAGKRGEYIPWKRVGTVGLDKAGMDVEGMDVEGKDVAGMEGLEGTVAGIALV